MEDSEEKKKKQEIATMEEDDDASTTTLQKVRIKIFCVLWNLVLHYMHLIRIVK